MKTQTYVFLHRSTIRDGPRRLNPKAVASSVLDSTSDDIKASMSQRDEFDSLVEFIKIEDKFFREVDEIYDYIMDLLVRYSEVPFRDLGKIITNFNSFVKASIMRMKRGALDKSDLKGVVCKFVANSWIKSNATGAAEKLIKT